MLFAIPLPDRAIERFKRMLPWIVGDALVIVACHLFVFSIRIQGGEYNSPHTAPFIAGIVLVNLLLLYQFRAYHRLWKQTSGYMILSLVWAVAIATALVLLASIPMRPRPLPISVILVSSALSLSGIVIIRYRSRLLSALDWRFRAVVLRDFPNKNIIRVLIVGAGESGGTLARRLQHQIRSEQGYKIVGFIDDDPTKQGLDIEGRPVLGDRTRIPQIVEDNDIELVIVAIHNIGGREFRDILAQCEKTTARIKVVPDMMALLDTTRRSSPIRDVQPEDLIGRSIIERHSSVDLSAVTQKVVLITGAAGSIGSELVQQMATYEPIRLILVDNNESALHDLFISLTAKYPSMDIHHVLCDVADRHELHLLFDAYRPQVVFHAAAYKHVPLLEAYPHQALRVNVGGTFNMARLAHQFKAERFVLISTDKAVRPSSIMGASKRLCEYIVHAYSRFDTPRTHYTAVRFGNVLGSRGSVVPTFNRQIDQGGPVTVTHPEMTRYFMSISEAVNLVIHAACMTNGDEIFLLRMGETVKILDIAERMIRLRGLRPHEDIAIEFTGTRPGEKLHEELHHDIEKPCETVHPSIFKLNGWDENNFFAEEFLNKIERLLQDGFAESPDPLQTLLRITSVDYDRLST